MKVRISRRVADFLAGSQVYQDLLDKGKAAVGEDEGTVRLMAAVMGAKTNSRGDRHVWLGGPEQDALKVFAGALYAGGKDNSDDPDGRADMLAAGWLIKKLEG